MSRGLVSANLTASQALHVRPLFFAELQFDTATMYVHNGAGNYVWGSQTWQGLGVLGTVSTIEEGLGLTSYGVSMELYALDPTVLAEAANEPVYARAMVLYIGFLDDSGVLVATPQTLWSGYGDHTSIVIGGEQDVVSLACESELRFLDLANGSRFTDEDQQRRYSGDVAFEYLPQMIDAQVTWGPSGQGVRFGNGTFSGDASDAQAWWENYRESKG